MKRLYNKLFKELESKMTIQEDKLEETVQSTLHALWFKACDNPKSAKLASGSSLQKISKSQESTLSRLVEERLNGKPLAYITGRQSFMGIELICDNRALIPRQETEILAKAAFQIGQEIAKSKPIVRILDVCCGSGNIGLALASLLSEALVYCADLSYEAVELTNENISFLNLGHKAKARQSDVFTTFMSDEFYGQIDMIVCNPPYISTSKFVKMNSEISNHEPTLAFDGGMFGLKIIQKLISESPKFLTDQGWIIFEIGVGQGPFITKLCQSHGAFDQIESQTDNFGNIRVIAARCKN